MRRSLMAAVLLVSLPMIALAATKQERLSKQTSTAANPDTATAAADTSSAMQLEKTLSNLWITVAAETTTVYEVQVSPDNVHWYRVDIDTTTATNCIETTADLGATYAGWWVRLIQDAAAAKSFGRGVVTQVK